MADYVSNTVNWDTIRSITHPKVSKKIADNITQKIPLLYFLNKMGNKEYESGGTNYVLPVMKSLPTGQSYKGNIVLDTVEADPTTVATYERKLLTVPVVATGTKMLQNSGNNPEAIVNYLAHIVENAEEGMKDTMAGTTDGIMSTNTESDTGITGLRNMLTDSTTTGTTGGLSRATYSFWRHNSDSVATGWNTDGMQSMRSLFFACVRGDESPSIIIMTQASYINFDRFLTGTVSYNTPSPKVAFNDYGAEMLYFRGVPVIFDYYMTAQRALMLNLKYLKLLVHRDRDMVIRDWITPTNQDSIVARIYWAGNLVCNNLARQGILQGLPDTWA